MKIYRATRTIKKLQEKKKRSSKIFIVYYDKVYGVVVCMYSVQITEKPLTCKLKKDM